MHELKTVIGLVGEKGSGKGMFYTLLKELLPSKSIIQIRFADLLFETLDAWHISPTRANLQNLAIVMDDAFGDGTLAKAVKHRIDQQLISNDIVVLDGIRWASQYDLLKSYTPHYLVYITADVEQRFKRTRLRAEKSDEKDSSFEQFLQEEQAKNETLIPEIGKQADFKIVNEGTLEEFAEKVKQFIKILESKSL